jgi:hypothetical protein
MSYRSLDLFRKTHFAEGKTSATKRKQIAQYLDAFLGREKVRRPDEVRKITLKIKG